MNRALHDIFRIVELALRLLARKLKISYEAANILVYYLLIPLSWALLIDIAVGTYYYTAAFITLCILVRIFVRDGETFAQNLFEYSVEFLLYFRRFGVGYIAASIIFCVIVPILLYAIIVSYI